MRNSFSILFTILFFSFLSFNSQAQYFWVGGTGNWSDFENHWATTSGGSTFHTAVPSSEDDVFFDENSFSSNDQQMTIDIPQATSYNFDCSAVLFNPTFYSSEYISIYGSVTLSGTASYNINEIYINYEDTGASITSNGAVLENSTVQFYNSSGDGILNLADDLSCNGFHFLRGIFNTNGYTLNIGYDIYILELQDRKF